MSDEYGNERGAGDFRDPGLRAEMDRLTILLYTDPGLSALAAGLSRTSAIDADDIRQEAAMGLVALFRNADRAGKTAPLVGTSGGEQIAYIRRTMTNRFNTQVGKHPVTVPIIEDVGEPSDEGSAVARADLDRIGRLVDKCCWAGPGRLGPAFDAQWRQSRDGRTRRLVARRFEEAALIVGWERRGEIRPDPAMLTALEQPLHSDDGTWLQPLVNRALGLVLDDWAYNERLPVDRQESTDYRFLLTECRGQTDARRAADEHGESSARQHGVNGLMRLVLAEVTTTLQATQPDRDR